MKLAYISDLHISENIPYSLFENIEADVICIAGDICNVACHSNLHKLLDYLSYKFEYVFYVLGNHDYYSASNGLQSIHEINLEQTSHLPNVIFLNNNFKTITINNVDYDFFGCTLWSKTESLLVQKYINDFRYIFENSYTPLRLETINKEYEKSIKAIEEFNLIESSNKIILTHFVPINNFIQDKWKINETYAELNSYFCNDLASYIETSNINLWICGHTHDGFDEYIGNTRIVCNPYGYLNENINPHVKVIEL